MSRRAYRAVAQVAQLLRENGYQARVTGKTCFEYANGYDQTFTKKWTEKQAQKFMDGVTGAMDQPQA